MAQDQMTFFDNEKLENNNQGPVECLGMNFPNDEARRKNIPTAEFLSVMDKDEQD